MRPMLDDLELPQVQEIATYDQRMLAEHKPPGKAGSLLQNMGRRSTQLVLWGVASGADAQKFVEQLDGKFRAGDPVPFTAEAVGPFMLGAFVNGPQVDAVIYDDHLDALIIVPPGPLDDMDDTGAWTQVFVTTGPYDDAELDAWGVDPARGPLPVGPSCEPVVDATAP